MRDSVGIGTGAPAPSRPHYEQHFEQLGNIVDPRDANKAAPDIYRAEEPPNMRVPPRHPDGYSVREVRAQIDMTLDEARRRRDYIRQRAESVIAKHAAEMAEHAAEDDELTTQIRGLERALGLALDNDAAQKLA